MKKKKNDWNEEKAFVWKKAQPMILVNSKIQFKKVLPRCKRCSRYILSLIKMVGILMDIRHQLPPVEYIQYLLKKYGRYAAEN